MKQFLFLLLLSVCTANANADTITYTHTGSGSGTLNGVTFGAIAPLNFTITAVGDTDDVVSFSGSDGFYINNISAFIHIDTLGSFDFTTATRFFVYNPSKIIGFSLAGEEGADLFNGPSTVDYWDMTSSIDPISGTAELLQWSRQEVDTTGGILAFNSSYGVASTFSATVAAVPEPSSYAVMLAGLGLLGFSSRKKPV